MKDFKIIATQKRELFEEKLRKYLDEGYEVKHTNLSISSPTDISTLKKFNFKIEYAFYAYLEKEI